MSYLAMKAAMRFSIVIMVCALVQVFDMGNCQQCSNLITSANCYRQASYLSSRTVYQTVMRYRAESYATYTACGWLWKDRCRSGTSYRSVSHVGTNSYTEYLMTYTTERYCCAGYAEQRGSCEPVALLIEVVVNKIPIAAYQAGSKTICNCASGQTCVAPYTCRHGSLNGLMLLNNSVIELSQLTSSCATLVCTTDLHSSAINTGRWYYPNGTEINTLSSSSGLYITHGGYREVYLHRRNNVSGPLGKYCCDHYNANINRETICTEIVEHVCNPPCHMGYRCIESNICISISPGAAFFTWTSQHTGTQMLYPSNALKITKPTADGSVTSEHSVVNLERSLSGHGLGILTYVISGVVAVVALVVVIIAMVIAVIRCRRRKYASATSSTIHFDNSAYDSSSHFESQQKFNEKDEPLYDEIVATEAADYEAFIQKKSEYDNKHLEKEVSFEMSQCSAYADRTLKKQN